MEATDVKKGKPRLGLSGILFIAISVSAVLGALIVRLHPMPTGMLGPLAGAASILLAFGMCFVALARSSGTPSASKSTILLLILSSGAELCGILTGFPFGDYEYTGLWWPSVRLASGRSFPLFVPLAWFIIVLGCYAIAARLTKKPVVVVLTGLLAAIVDIAMEPVMTGPVGFWKWRQALGIYSAPVQNFAGWFLTAAAAAAVLRAFQCRSLDDEPMPALLILALLVLTLAIGCIYAQWNGLVALPIILLISVLLKPRSVVH